MTPEQKHYYAFVSHSSRDAKIALWLRDKLVNYNIPASIRKENQMPKRLRPVFIYQTDLAGANLQDALQRELEDSQWLIVICSPDGAKSQYVNGEVEHFINTGRANRIIPFIVGGTPHAKNPDDECFPPALLKLAEDGIELRGVNLAECQKQLGSKMGAVVNVVATMLGVRFDSMWNVYQRKQRRLITIAAVVAAFICLAGLLTWDYLRPTYKYFADYVDKWGVPEGIIPVSKEQFKHRHATWQFTYRRTPLGEPGAWKWRVTEVKHVNFAGRPVEIEEHETRRGRAAGLQLIYNKQTGQVAQYIFSNESGKILLRHVLSEYDNKPACIADFMNAKEGKGQGYVATGLSGFYHHDMEEDYLNSSIARYVYERNDDGYIIKQTFHTSNDYNLSRSAMPDAFGIYGFLFMLDSLGRPLRVDYINEKGKMMRNAQGVAAERYEYDAFSGLSKIQYVNISGKPILHPDGHWATKCNDYDQWGNASEIYYLDTIGNPYLCSTLGKVTYRYDMYGNRIEEAYWDLDDQPLRWSEYLDYSRILYVHDKQGRVIEETYWDANGDPCSTIGSHKETYKYDARGLEIEHSYWDAKGQRCYNVWEFAMQKNKYNTDGKCIERAYYGIDEKPCNSQSGYSVQVLAYDDRGNMIEESYYNADGELCYNDWNEYPKQTDKYDSRGRSIETTFWGTDGELIPDSIGCPRITRNYDDQGLVTELAFWDADWQPCSSSRGFARSESMYDDQSKEMEVTYYGEDGLPCLYEGYAKIKHLFDERGNELESRFYDAEGRLTIIGSGYAIVARQYDVFNNMIQEAYFDANEKPCLRDWGCAKMVRVYDERSNEIERTYFGIDDKPCMLHDGFSKWVKRYNSRGNIIEASYYDTEGNLCMLNDEEIGIRYARYTCEYDDRGNLKEKLYFDKDGKEVQVAEN